jgi:hypothetical protein
MSLRSTERLADDALDAIAVDRSAGDPTPDDESQSWAVDGRGTRERQERAARDAVHAATQHPVEVGLVVQSLTAPQAGGVRP